MNGEDILKDHAPEGNSETRDPVRGSPASVPSAPPGFPRLKLTLEELAARLPVEMVQARRWVAWRTEARGGKPTKPPVNPRSGGYASTANPNTWSTLHEAMDYHTRFPDSSGVGFVLGDGFAGVDLDHCYEDGRLTPWTRDLIDRMGTYCEISPSGGGVKLFLRGAPRREGKRGDYPVPGSSVEVYGSGRYFTVTGQALVDGWRELVECKQALTDLIIELWPPKSPGAATRLNQPASAEDDDIIRKAREARNGRAFEQLWQGNWNGYPSQSEADLALAGTLAFWVGPNPAQIDRLFRCSGLMREKWDRPCGQGGTYGQRTVSRVLEDTDLNPRRATAPQIPRNPQNNGALTGSGDHGNSGEGSGARDPAAWEPPIKLDEYEVPGFPAEILPPWLRDFVTAESVATQTPIDLAGMLSLAVLATACAGKVRVKVRDGYEEPANIFVAVVLEPGNRKSAVFRDVIAPLEAFEAEETLRVKDDIARARQRRRILEQRLRRIETDAARGCDDAGGADAGREADLVRRELDACPAVYEPRLIMDECTPEKLARVLYEQGGRIAQLSPEGDVFDILAGRYSGVPNFTVYLKGHAGDTLRVDRIGREPEFIPSPALTLGLAVQPNVIRGLMNQRDFRGRGLVGRFLYALPKSLLGHRSVEPPPVSRTTLATYASAVRALLSLPGGADHDSRPANNVLRLDDDAVIALMDFQREIEPRLGDYADLSSMTDWAGKLVGAVARVTGLLHMADSAGLSSPWDVPIARDCVERAVLLGRYLIAHAQAAYGQMGADPTIAGGRLLLGWIQQAAVSSFTKREAYQALKGRFRTVADLDPFLQLLEEHRYLRRCAVEHKSGPGRKPSPSYEVSPYAREQALSPARSCAADPRPKSEPGPQPQVTGEMGVVDGDE